MKVIVLILSLATALPAFAKGDHDFTLDGITEGRSADVDGCTSGNCPQKQWMPLLTEDVSNAQIDAITKVNEVLGPGGTTKGAK